MEDWRAYRNLPTLFRTVPSSTPYGLLFFQDWGFTTPPKTSIAIISGTGKATDLKFGRYIDRVHPNKSPLKILEKRECKRIHPGTANLSFAPRPSNMNRFQ